MDLKPEAIAFKDRYVWVLGGFLFIDNFEVPLPNLEVEALFIVGAEILI